MLNYFVFPIYSLVEFSHKHSVLHDICKTLSKNLNLPKGALTTFKLNEIVQCSWKQQEEFPKIKDATRTKQTLKSRFRNEIESLEIEEKEFSRLIRNLKSYTDLSAFKRRDFIVSLSNLVLSIGKTVNTFDYGELICYMPLVQKILSRTQRKINESNHTEIVQISLNGNATLSSLVSYNLLNSLEYSLKINNKTIFHFVKNKDPSLPVESIEEIIGLFENFVDESCTDSILDKIPTMSMHFIFQIFRCIHTIEIHLLDEIMINL